MKITKPELRQAIAEVLKEYSDSTRVTDVDDGSSIHTTLQIERGMVTIRFGDSFTLHLDSDGAKNLGARIREAGLQLEDEIAGRHPGGSIG